MKNTDPVSTLPTPTAPAKVELPTELKVPAGYRLSGIAAGLKKSGRLDLSLFVADTIGTSFGVFTQNLVRAASVDWNEQKIGATRAVVINSGNANACTGQQGTDNNQRMAEQVATTVGCSIDEVLVMSTGIIGEHLPMETVDAGIRAAHGALGTDYESVCNAARGMLTTDTFPKVATTDFEVDGKAYSILGMAKGAGMIGPRMATMLALFLTDFPLAGSESNRKQFRAVMDRTFNRISVDGHTSTSDQSVLLAQTPDDTTEAKADSFFESLQSVSTQLARMIPRDGEGATHLVTVRVTGPFPEKDLDVVARTIADSPLVKTAVFGADPNWGRIVSAAGYSGVRFDPAQMSLKINGHRLYQHGTPVTFDGRQVSESMRNQVETEIELSLGEPVHSTEFWTSDLTYDYVRINAEYHT